MHTLADSLTAENEHVPVIKDVHTYVELQKLFPNLIKLCCSIGFEYIKLDETYFCKIAYYYTGTTITYDPRDDRPGQLDYKMFEIMLVYTDDQELDM